MIAFEVYVNRVKVCTAGIEDFDLVMSNLFCATNKDGRPDESKIVFSVSGVADKRHFNWVHYNMYVGSRVEIRIVNSSEVDTPKKVSCSGGACATWNMATLFDQDGP